MKIKRLTTDAVCAAIYVALASFASLKLGPMTISVDGLPILLGALLFGPADGLIIGALGGFVSQLIGYGLMPTTILWMLPPMVLGVTAGFLAKILPWKTRNTGYYPPRLAILFAVSLFLDTTVTTGVSWLDCQIIGYSFAYYIPTIVWRYIADVIKVVLYAVLIPAIVSALKKSHAV